MCGTLLVLVGVLVHSPASLGPLAPMAQRSLESVLGNTGLTLVLIGLATGLASVVIAGGSTESPAVQVNLDAVLGGVDSTPIGSTFDGRLRRLGRLVSRDRRADLESELREEVRETAVTVLVRNEGLSVAESRARLDEGSWTTDPQAEAFFSPLPPRWLVRLREWVRVRPAVEQRLERVLAELESKLELEGEPSSRETERPSAGVLDVTEEAVEGTVRHRIDEIDGAGPDDQVAETVRANPGDASESVATPRRFGLTVGLVAVAVGLVTNVTTPFMLGLLAVGYSLTKYVTSTSASAVEVTRVLATDSPVPGDLVEVELTVENVGDRTLPDVRVVDGVPNALRVVEGSPSMATALQPDGSASVRYTLQALRGTYGFDETQVVLRDLGNVRERTIGVAVSTRLTGATRLDDLPLREQASQRIGAVKADRGGSGVEFYGTREYRPGDPLSRVNWNQLAKTGELTTVEFREQRAPIVAIVLDQREAARVAPTEGVLDGVDLSVYAAEQAFLALLDMGTEVGLIAYGEHLTDIEPASGPTQRALVQSRLRAATDRYAAALGEADVDATGAVYQRRSPEPAMIDRHVPPNAQVLVLSPATDDFAVEVTDRLAAFGHPVTLLSPAVTGTGSLGARRQRLDRACRLGEVRDRGTRVIDWEPSEPVQMAISRATEAMP